MELQARGRAVRLGQTEPVYIFVPYITGGVDDLHREKHREKTSRAILITGDAQVDDMYRDDFEVDMEIDDFVNSTIY